MGCQLYTALYIGPGPSLNMLALATAPPGEYQGSFMDFTTVTSGSTLTTKAWLFSAGSALESRSASSYVQAISTMQAIQESSKRREWSISCTWLYMKNHEDKSSKSFESSHPHLGDLQPILDHDIFQLLPGPCHQLMPVCNLLLSSWGCHILQLIGIRMVREWWWTGDLHFYHVLGLDNSRKLPDLWQITQFRPQFLCGDWCQTLLTLLIGAD